MFIVNYIYMDIIACTINLVISFQAAMVFGEKMRKRDLQIRIMHSTGCLASLFGVTYSIFRLTYWFGGTKNVTCDNLLLIGGLLFTFDVILALIHLLLRADMINRKNNKNWPICRAIALFFMLFNIVSFGVYLKMRAVTELPNGKCVYIFNQKALVIRYIGQATNHIVQTSLFVYPLTSHIYRMKKSQKEQEIGINTNIYSKLAYKATITMIIATLYTTSLAIMFGFYNISAEVKKIIVPLSIFDMALTLGSICYASTSVIKLKPIRRPSDQHTHRPSILLPNVQRRSSYTPSIENEV
jgi:hypothetical protein